MEKLKRIVKEITYEQDHSKLSPLHRSFIPLLSFTSSLYSITLSLRHNLYHYNIFSKQRLPVPVISVGNLTWGGNGKTPMVEFIALWLADSGISPLILTRGYAGGDEARMLTRHFHGKPVKIGVGANRAATAASFFEKYGYVDPCLFKGQNFGQKIGDQLMSKKIGAVVLDDGMQHWSLQRELEIVMVNGLMPWGNRQLLPHGPLREPLTALRRADVAVVHHSSLVSEEDLNAIELSIREVNKSIYIFYTKMSPCYFFEVGNINSRISPDIINDAVVLCVSAIGSANAFVQGVEKMGALYIDRLDFSDHHSFNVREMAMIKTRLRQLEDKFGSKPAVVITEKDYDRDPDIMKHLSPFKVMVLCSELQFIPYKGCSEDGFKKSLKELLEVKLSMCKPN